MRQLQGLTLGTLDDISQVAGFGDSYIRDGSRVAVKGTALTPNFFTYQADPAGLAPDGKFVIKSNFLPGAWIQGPPQTAAVVTFDLVVDFTNPSPSFNVVPVPDECYNATFSGFTNTFGIIETTWKLSVPVPQNRRADLVSLHLLGITDLSPVVPIALIVQSASDDTYVVAAIANNPPPPQGSPPLTVEYHAVMVQLIQ